MLLIVVSLVVGESHEDEMSFEDAYEDDPIAAANEHPEMLDDRQANDLDFSATDLKPDTVTEIIPKLSAESVQEALENGKINDEGLKLLNSEQLGDEDTLELVDNLAGADKVAVRDAIYDAYDYDVGKIQIDLSQLGDYHVKDGWLYYGDSKIPLRDGEESLDGLKMVSVGEEGDIVVVGPDSSGVIKGSIIDLSLQDGYPVVTTTNGNQIKVDGEIALTQNSDGSIGADVTEGASAEIVHENALFVSSESPNEETKIVANSGVTVEKSGFLENLGSKKGVKLKGTTLSFEDDITTKHKINKQGQIIETKNRVVLEMGYDPKSKDNNVDVVERIRDKVSPELADETEKLLKASGAKVTIAAQHVKKSPDGKTDVYSVFGFTDPLLLLKLGTYDKEKASKAEAFRTASQIAARKGYSVNDVLNSHQFKGLRQVKSDAVANDFGDVQLFGLGLGYRRTIDTSWGPTLFYGVGVHARITKNVLEGKKAPAGELTIGIGGTF